MTCAVNEVRTNLRAKLETLSLTGSLVDAIDEQHVVDLCTIDGRCISGTGLVVTRLLPEGLELPQGNRAYRAIEVSIICVRADWSSPGAVVAELWETFDTIVEGVENQDLGGTGVLVSRSVRLHLTSAAITRVPKTAAPGIGPAVLVITFASEGDLWS